MIMLPRQVSLGVGLAVAGLVAGIYYSTMPTVAEVRVSEADDDELTAAERTAMWASLGAVSAVSLIAKDPTVFVFGGTTLIALSWINRHANHYSATLGSSVMPSSRLTMDAAREADGYVPAV